jgi:crotonobetainyl-CoA:carnitine CoA-transferase CaiB-like acyl-CoA transferase
VANWDHVDADQWGLNARYRMYPTSDGWVAIAVLDGAAWSALGGAVDGVGGVAHGDDAGLAALLEPWFAGRTAEQAFKTLDAAGVPAEIVDEDFCREVFDDPELRARGWISQTSAGGVGRFEDPGLLVDFSETPGVVTRGPCLCGEHTREILLELGYSDADVDTLAADRVVLDNPGA